MNWYDKFFFDFSKNKMLFSHCFPLLFWSVCWYCLLSQCKGQNNEIYLLVFQNNRHQYSSNVNKAFKYVFLFRWDFKKWINKHLLKSLGLVFWILCSPWIEGRIWRHITGLKNNVNWKLSYLTFKYK